MNTQILLKSYSNPTQNRQKLVNVLSAIFCSHVLGLLLTISTGFNLEAQSCSKLSGSYIIFTESDWYNLPQEIDKDVIIKQGSIVNTISNPPIPPQTLHSEYRFKENVKIIVEKNAQLHFDGITFTHKTTCQRWSGFVIEGQNSLRNLGSQGYLELINCSIKYAEKGILSQGLIDVRNSNFLNNKNSVNLINSNVGGNAQKLFDCTFDWDNNAELTNNMWPAEVHLDINNHHGVLIRGNEFNCSGKTNFYFAEDRGIGIKIYNSKGIAITQNGPCPGSDIQHSCEPPNPFCGCSTPPDCIGLKNRFYKLGTGIFCSVDDIPNLNTYSIDILENEFVNCMTGINLYSDVHNAYIRGNSIFLDNDIANYHSGFGLFGTRTNGAANLEISQNLISFDNNIGVSNTYYGIEIVNTKGSNSLVFKNQLIKTADWITCGHYRTQANLSTTGNNSGLDVVCNIFSTNYNNNLCTYTSIGDWIIEDLLKDQGTPTKGVENVFQTTPNICSWQAFQIDDLGATAPIQYYRSNLNQYIPTCLNNGNMFFQHDATGEPDCSNNYCTRVRNLDGGGGGGPSERQMTDNKLLDPNITIYPNPVSGNIFTVSIGENIKVKCMTLFDIYGLEIQLNVFNLNNGTFQCRSDLQLHNGIYRLNVILDSGTNYSRTLQISN